MLGVALFCCWQIRRGSDTTCGPCIVLGFRNTEPMSLEKTANDSDVRSKGIGHIIFAIVLYILAPLLLFGHQLLFVLPQGEDLNQGHLVVMLVLAIGPIVFATVLMLYGLTKMKERARADFTTTLKMSRQLDLIYKNMGNM